MTTVSTPRKIAATATAGATLAKGRHTPVNAAAGPITMTLPTGAAEGSIVSVEKLDGTGSAVSITGNVRGVAAQTLSLVLQYEVKTLIADATGSWWPVGGDKTKSSLDASYLTRQDRLSGLPTVSYWSHRGGSKFAPEQTMEAFRISTDCGADVLDMDLQPLADGALGLMHDSTVDRTTDGSGLVANFTAPAWRALNAAAKIPWNGKVVPPAILSEVFGEFGGKRPLSIEPKDAANATQLMNLADAYGLGKSVIINTASTSVVAAATARGYATYFYWGASISSPSVSSVVALNPTFLGVDGVNATDADITTLVNTGIPVVPYTIDRRVRKNQLLALGVKGFLSDQMPYIKSSTAQRTTDSWKQGVLGHGVNASNPALPATISAGRLVLAGPLTYQSIGEVSPITNAAGSYTIDVDMGWTTLPTDLTGAVVWVFGCADDSLFLNQSPSYRPGWMAYARANGNVSLFRVDGTTTATNLGTITSSAAVAGSLMHLRIAVTPTTVTLTRTDSGGFTPVTVTDSANRGGYNHAGCYNSSTGAVFANLSIT